MDLLVGGDYCPNYRLARPGYKFQGTKLTRSKLDFD